MPKKPPSKSPGKNTGRRASDEAADITPDEKESVGWSAYLFGRYNAEAEKVSLMRTWPKEHLGVPTFGWLEDLGPGVDEEYIREHHGGGRFQLNKCNRDTGKIMASCSLEIAGLPKVTSASADPNQAGEDQAVAAPPVMLNIGGVEVPYTENLAKLTDFVMAMKAIKAVFPDPTPPMDINAALLELVLNKNPLADSLEAMRAFKEVAGVAEHSSETGSNVYDLLKSTIEQAGPVMRAMISPPVKPLPGMVRSVPGPDVGPGPGNGPGNGSGKEAVALPETTENESITKTNERGPMSQRELILAVASTIMSCWKLDPPKDVAETVTMVDLILQQSDQSTRKLLAELHSDTILTICETGLAEEWLIENSAVGNREDFGVFFEKVFAEYVRPDRQVVQYDN